MGGHKTGLYLDQQRNYQWVAGLASQGQVLDCFSFLGGFGLHCARAGAAHVHGLDQSAEACAALHAPRRTQWAGRQMGRRNRECFFDWMKARTSSVAPSFMKEWFPPSMPLYLIRPPSHARAPRWRAGRLARLQGNPSAGAEAAQAGRDAGHVLLFASRRMRRCSRALFWKRPSTPGACCCAAWPPSPNRLTTQSCRRCRRRSI